MLSQETMAALMTAEEKRLGVNSPEFMERHNEIMNLIEQARNKGPCQCSEHQQEQ